MLRTAHEEVKKHYYDPNFHGLDWDARYRTYAAAMAKVQDPGEGLIVVSSYLAGLKDSHTYFVPPERVNHIELGYQLSLVGDDCFVTEIRPKTDAEKKLHIGDQVLSVDGYRADRKDFIDLMYLIRVLEPQRTLRNLCTSLQAA
jgi:C-terminal processing protease CtpA/Prc